MIHWHRAPLRAAFLLAPLAALAQLPPGDGPITTPVTVLEPSPVKFEDALLARLTVPPGFRVSVFAKDLQNVRWLQPMPNGDVYASRREQGDVLLLRDRNGDGTVDEQRIVAQNLTAAHGLALRGKQLYITAEKKVLVADVQADGSLSTPRVLIDDLPDAGQHPNRTLAFGPDGMLYITVGSTCNDCRDANPENATVLRALPDGSARAGFARGLRNTIGFGWHPASGLLYGFDHGSDYHGDDLLACSGGPTRTPSAGAAAPPPISLVGRTVIEGANVFPEGIAVDARTGDAYVGSSSNGDLWRLRPGSDKAELFQAGGAFGRQAAFGMKVDVAGRLWVAGGPQGNVAVVHLDTGMPVANLQGPKGAHAFLNDLVLAPDNHVYVTDSFRPMLFRARQVLDGSPQLEPWLDLTQTPIRYQPNQINLNGIVASPDGRWLMAIQLVTGELWRIDIATRAVTQVAVDGGDLRHGDGLVLRGAGELLVVRNEEREIVQLALDADWRRARVTRRVTEAGFKYPSTAAAGPRGLMVVNAQLDKRKQPPPMLPFDVVTIGWP